jgi:hypothetical protein
MRPSQPQRGCVLQPRVDVRGYPGNRDGLGLWQSQRLSVQQPQRGCVTPLLRGSSEVPMKHQVPPGHPVLLCELGDSGSRDTTALRLRDQMCAVSQGSRGRQPWAGGHNRVAVANRQRAGTGVPALRATLVRKCQGSGGSGASFPQEFLVFRKQLVLKDQSGDSLSIIPATNFAPAVGSLVIDPRDSPNYNQGFRGIPNRSSPLVSPAFCLTASLRASR